VDVEKADSKREEVKNELAQEYQKNKEPKNEFMNEFCEKHKVSLPNRPCQALELMSYEGDTRSKMEHLFHLENN